MSSRFPEGPGAVCFFLLLFYLAALCLWDLRKRAVPLRLLLAGGAGGILFRFAEIVFGEKTGREQLLLLPALLPGLLLLLFSEMTGGDPGKGDALCVLSLGLWLGLQRLLSALFLAGLLLALPGTAICLLRRRTLKQTLPFLPFLAGAVLLVCLFGGGAALP